MMVGYDYGVTFTLQLSANKIGIWRRKSPIYNSIFNCYLYADERTNKKQFIKTKGKNSEKSTQKTYPMFVFVFVFVFLVFSITILACSIKTGDRFFISTHFIPLLGFGTRTIGSLKEYLS